MYDQNKKRLSVRRTAEATERGKRANNEDAALRRSLAASSLGRERVSGPKTSSDLAPTQPYKQDSEAYKRRKSPVSSVMKILKSQTHIDGNKIR